MAIILCLVDVRKGLKLEKYSGTVGIEMNVAIHIMWISNTYDIGRRGNAIWTGRTGIQVTTIS